MFRIAVVVGLVAYATAHNFNISPKCTSALVTVAADPGVSKCLATPAFTPVIAAGDTSIVKPFDNWLASMCSAPACTNDNLGVVVNGLTSGCSAELTALRIPTDKATLLKIFQKGYPIFRKIACLKHGSTFCVTETLTNVEKVTGPLTLKKIVQILNNPPKSVPASILCTDCNKETYNLLAPVITSSAVKPFLQSQCGASFVDGSTPSSITVPT